MSDRKNLERGHAITRAALEQHQLDAEYILEEVLNRARFTAITRDALAEQLDRVSRGFPLGQRHKHTPKEGKRAKKEAKRRLTCVEIPSI